MSGKLKSTTTILIGVLLLLSVSGVAVYDYFGVADKYQKPLEYNYELAINQLHDSGLLEVSCFFWSDHVSMTATLDNTSTSAQVNALIAGLRTYICFYNKFGFPNKAEIDINKPGGSAGTQIASGTVYSKWVEDYNADMEKTNETIALRKIANKFAETIREP
jgi:hypothetical protein